MKDKIHVEVEPLSESRWSKVDAGVFAALDGASHPSEQERPVKAPTRRAFVYGVVGFAAAAALAAVASRSLLSPGVTPAPVQASRIVTGASPSHVALGGSSLDVAPDSAVVASGDDARGLLVVLERGKVDCEVEPRNGRPPFVVLAGDVRVRVVGTHFDVTRTGESVAVHVDHGAVEVTSGARIQVLHDGESWPAAPPPAESAEAPKTPETPSSAPPPAHAPPRTAAPARDPNADQKAFERASSLEVRDADASLATYKRLGAGSGPWAAPALFAAGRLAADRGRTAEARALLGDYLARFPNGPNAADARRLLGNLR